MNIRRFERQLQWQSSEFYWAILSGPLTRDRGALGYLFERFLPVPIDEVQAAYQRLADGRVVACGVEHVRLREVLDEGALTLSPSEPPAFPELQESPDSVLRPERLNLLVGPCEPAAVARRRRACLAVLGTAALLCAAMVVLGLERRAAAMRDDAAYLDRQRLALSESALSRSSLQPTSSPGNRSSSAPVEQRLLAELRRLELSRPSEAVLASLGATAVTSDAGKTLAALLRAWPEPELLARTESISITPTSVSMHGTVADTAAATRWSEAIRGTKDWDLQQPSVQATREGVRVTMHLKPGGQVDQGVPR